MDSNKILEIVQQGVEKQLNENNPKETKQTLQRLKKRGLSEAEAKSMITVILMEEMFQVFKNKNTFDIQGYIAKLNEL